MGGFNGVGRKSIFGYKVQSYLFTRFWTSKSNYQGCHLSSFQHSERRRARHKPRSRPLLQHFKRLHRRSHNPTKLGLSFGILGRRCVSRAGKFGRKSPRIPKKPDKSSRRNQPPKSFGLDSYHLNPPHLTLNHHCLTLKQQSDSAKY